MFDGDVPRKQYLIPSFYMSYMKFSQEFENETLEIQSGVIEGES